MKKLLILCLYVAFLSSCEMETNEQSPDYLSLALEEIGNNQAFMSFLGGLDLFVNENYNNDNQHSAPINLMQVRYETMLMSVWAEIWDQ